METISVTANAYSDEAYDLPPCKHGDAMLSFRMGTADQHNSKAVARLQSDRAVISEVEGVTRTATNWDGGTAELVTITTAERIDITYESSRHLIVLYDRGARVAGETKLGTLSSSLRDFGKKLTFIPAGHAYRDSLTPRGPVRIVLYYFGRNELRPSEYAFPTPRLFFEDRALLGSMLKLQSAILVPDLREPNYLMALGTLLMHEVFRAERPVKDNDQAGLAPWQHRVVTSYIEDHLTEQIPLTTLARLARLSTHHFCRAFKKSVGIPPHRYHMTRRIEQAKDLLAERTRSITEIGFSVGYSETSSFTTAFRKSLGISPSHYRRNLG